MELPELKYKNKTLNLQTLHFTLWARWGRKRIDITMDQLKNEIWRLFGVDEKTISGVETVSLIISCLLNYNIIYVNREDLFEITTV